MTYLYSFCCVNTRAWLFSEDYPVKMRTMNTWHILYVDVGNNLRNCTTCIVMTLNKNTLKRERQIANPCRRYSHIQYSSFYSLCKCRNAETRANFIQGCHSQLWNRFGSLFRLTTREAGLSSKSIPLCTPLKADVSTPSTHITRAFKRRFEFGTRVLSKSNLSKNIRLGTWLNDWNKLVELSTYSL